MAATLKVLEYPSTAAGICKGTGTRHGKTYASFRCRVGVVTVYARPLAGGRVCASTVSLRACRILAKPVAGPLAGDPTVCDVTRPTAAEKAHDCAQAAAKQAVLTKHGSPQVNLVCEQAGTVYQWSCTAASGSYTVTFTRGATAWTTTVTP